MLVLSRKKGDALVIAGDIRVVVIDVKGDSIRLGIEAPKQVPVHRQEVFDRLAAGQVDRLAAGQIVRPAAAQGARSADGQPPAAKQSVRYRRLGQRAAVSV